MNHTQFERQNSCVIQIESDDDSGSPISRPNFDASSDSGISTSDASTTIYETDDNLDEISDFDKNLFSRTSDKFAEEQWYVELERMDRWIKQTSRKMRLMAKMWKHADRMIEPSKPPADWQRLMVQLLNLTINRSQEQQNTFATLFDLVDMLDYYQGPIVSSMTTVETICGILKAFFNTPASFGPLGDSRLKSFLRDEYDVHGSRVRDIFPGWKKSKFFNEKCYNLIKNERRYLAAYFFNILIDKFDARLKTDQQMLPSILELGMKNFDFLTEFLTIFDIPFSGPYRRETPNGPKLQIFISSVLTLLTL